MQTNCNKKSFKQASYRVILVDWLFLYPNMSLIKDIKQSLATKWMQSATITRDNKGNIIGAKSGSQSALYDVDRYLAAFNSVYAGKNFVTLFHSISELQFPIIEIAKRVMKAEFRLKDYDSDSIIWENKQINKFLTQPNELQGFSEFMKEVICYLLVTGDSYMYSAVSDSLSGWDRWKACDNYYVLPADCIEPQYPFDVKLFSNVPKSDLIKSYKLISGMGNRDFSTNNILHFKESNLMFDHWKLRGRSKLTSLEYPLSNLCAVYEARNVIYVKRGALGAIVSNKTDDAGTVALSKNEKDSLQKTFNENYGLEREKGQFILSDIPVNYIKFGMSITELEPFEETLADAVAIAGAFGMPAVLTPRKDMSTYSNMDTAEKAFYTNTVIPLTEKIIDSINQFLGLRKEKGGMYIHADFSKVEVLQDNKKDEATTDNLKTTTALLKYNQGIITYNMLLIQCGEEKVDGGDYYIWDDPNLAAYQKLNINILLVFRKQ